MINSRKKLKVSAKPKTRFAENTSNFQACPNLTINWHFNFFNRGEIKIRKYKYHSWPYLTNPTRLRWWLLSRIWPSITSDPGKAIAPAPRLALATVHISPASTGVVSSSISLPYRQSPASNLNESRAPKPASRTCPWSELSKCSVTFLVSPSGMDIS